VTVKRAAAWPGDVQVTAADLSTASQVLSWRPRISLRDGMTRQVAWLVGLDETVAATYLEPDEAEVTAC
jgi:nucleoside-diphosphate-sugar epimerase